MVIKDGIKSTSNFYGYSEKSISDRFRYAKKILKIDVD